MHENILGESKTYLIDELVGNAGDVIKKQATIYVLGVSKLLTVMYL